MDILQAFQGLQIPERSVAILDETLREELVFHIESDVTGYITAPDPKVYTMSSYGLTFTFSQRKVKKLWKIDIDAIDLKQLHAFYYYKLKGYVDRYVRNINMILYVDISEKGAYHLHGFCHGDVYNIQRVSRFHKRNFGFTLVKPIFSFCRWQEYCQKAVLAKYLQPIQLVRRAGAARHSATEGENSEGE